MTPIRRALRAIKSALRDIDRGFSVFYGGDAGERSERTPHSSDKR